MVAEIEELRRRGLEVIAGSSLRPNKNESSAAPGPSLNVVVLQPFRVIPLMRALWLCFRRWRRIADLFRRVVLQGKESLIQRVKALLHTWLGAYYAVRLEGRGIEHIHVHHGYFGSWIAMVAARLLNVGFSMTLHGSDLLLHGAYLDTKLKNCRFCLTISGFNRRYIVEHFPGVEGEKVVVARLGVDIPQTSHFPDFGPQKTSLARVPSSPFSQWDVCTSSRPCISGAGLCSTACPGHPLRLFHRWGRAGAP